MAEVQNGGRIPGIIQALGKFLKGLKEYNLLELLKVLFALACVTFMVILVTKPELFFAPAAAFIRFCALISPFSFIRSSSGSKGLTR